MDEKCPLADLWEMAGSQLFQLLRWMQRIGEQQQTIGDGGIFSKQHTGLTAAVRVAAHTYSRVRTCAQFVRRLSQSLAILYGARRMRRPESPMLPERQIASQHPPAHF